MPENDPEIPPLERPYTVMFMKPQDAQALLGVVGAFPGVQARVGQLEHRVRGMQSWMNHNDMVMVRLQGDITGLQNLLNDPNQFRDLAVRIAAEQQANFRDRIHQEEMEAQAQERESAELARSAEETKWMLFQQNERRKNQVAWVIAAPILLGVASGVFWGAMKLSEWANSSDKSNLPTPQATIVPYEGTQIPTGIVLTATPTSRPPILVPTEIRQTPQPTKRITTFTMSAADLRSKTPAQHALETVISRPLSKDELSCLQSQVGLDRKNGVSYNQNTTHQTTCVK